MRFHIYSSFSERSLKQFVFLEHRVTEHIAAAEEKVSGETRSPNQQNVDEVNVDSTLHFESST